MLKLRAGLGFEPAFGLHLTPAHRNQAQSHGPLGPLGPLAAVLSGGSGVTASGELPAAAWLLSSEWLEGLERNLPNLGIAFYLYSLLWIVFPSLPVTAPLRY